MAVSGRTIRYSNLLLIDYLVPHVTVEINSNFAISYGINIAITYIAWPYVNQKCSKNEQKYR